MGKRRRKDETTPDETTPDPAAAPATQEAPPDDPAPDQTSEDPAPDQTLPGDLPEEDPPQVELGEASGGPPESGGDSGERFGVYDPVRLRFLGGVYGTRGDARKAAAAMGVRNPEIRPL